jgi:hypothetical protein
MRENWTEDDCHLAGAMSVLLGNMKDDARNAVLAHVAVHGKPEEWEIVKNIVAVDEINGKWNNR